MGNARLFFIIEKRVKKIRWKEEERDRNPDNVWNRNKEAAQRYNAGSFNYVHVNLDFLKQPRLDQVNSVKEALTDRSLNAKFFSETDNRAGEHIDFRALSDLKILKR